MPSRVLVTGAGGFLAPYVGRALRERGFVVRGTVRGPATLPDFDETAVIRGLDDVQGLNAAMAGASAVVHLAARVHVMRDVVADPLAAFRHVNVQGTATLLDAAAAAGVRRFVYMSSVKAVGEGNTAPWTDDVSPAPVDPYGISKLEAERLVLERSRALGIEPVILRLPMVYGARVKGNMLRLLQLVDRGIPLPFGSIRNRRSLVYAANVGWAVGQAVTNRDVVGRTFFLADGEDLSTPELIRRIARALGRDARLIPVPVGIFAAGGLVGDVLAKAVPFPLTSAAVHRLTSSLAVDASGFSNVAGPMPATVDQGLAETAAWYLATKST